MLNTNQDIQSMANKAGPKKEGSEQFSNTQQTPTAAPPRGPDTLPSKMPRMQPMGGVNSLQKQQQDMQQRRMQQQSMNQYAKAR